jgi:uncharacterized protein (DUF427 family)
MAPKMTLEPAPRPVSIRTGDAVIGESADALVLREGEHDPVIYVPRAAVEEAFLEASETRTRCPHKGEARYFHVSTPAGLLRDAAWSYETPMAPVEALAGRLAFDPERVAVETL